MSFLFYEPPLDPKSDYVIYEWYLEDLRVDLERRCQCRYHRRRQD